MRLRELQLESFGAFEDESLALPGPVSVFFGENEAGKSTLLAAIETLLYGFEPASRERHPLARTGGPPESAAPTLAGIFALPGGDTLRVERRLGSRPTLRISRTDDAGDGSEANTGTVQPNRPLREVEGTPRALYRSIYALTAAQLVEPEQDVRAAVDELLLGENALPGLRPVHKVLEGLRSERQELWRADNRGKPLARALRSELNAARKAFHAACSAEEDLRGGLVEEAELARELERAAARRRELERERDDAAFVTEALELRERRAARGRLDLSGLGEDPLGDPEELEREASELAALVAEHETRLQRRVELTSTHARILERAGAIEAARTARGRYEARQEAIEDARDRMRHTESEALAAWTRLAGGRPQRSQLSRLRGFPLESLRAELAAWEEAREVQAAGGAATWLGWISAALGTGIVVATSLDRLAPGFVALGLTFLFLAYLELRVRGLARRRSETPPAVVRALGHLQLPANLASTPLALARLVDQLEAATARLDELEASEDRTLALARELEVQEEEWEDLLEDLQLGGAAEGVEAAARLEGALERAREREARVRADQEARERAQAVVDANRPRLEELRARLARLDKVLRRNVLGETDRGAAFRTLHERLRELEYLDGRLAELKLDPRWPRLVEGPGAEDDGPGGEVELGAAALVGARADAARERELAELEERCAEVHRRLGELAAERRDSPANRVALARERVVELETELADVRRRHDRLALAEAVLVRADRRWRAAHQPDVLRRAGAYLAEITDGRYTRLEYPPGGTGGTGATGATGATGSLLVIGPDGEPHAAAPPLSRGTRDQIYLSLRLGLLDHLDEGRTPLPLVLDEALVHWDAPRRARLYPLLARVARRRHVLVTTCHEPLAAEAAHALGTTPIMAIRCAAPYRR